MPQHIRYPADPSQGASSSQAGQVTTGAQDIAGVKNFTSKITSGVSNANALELSANQKIRLSAAATLYSDGAESHLDQALTLAADMRALTYRQYNPSSAPVTLQSDSADASNVAAVAVDTTNAFTTAGRKLLSVRNAGVEKFSIDKDGGATFGGPLNLGTQGITTTGTVNAGNGGFLGDFLHRYNSITMDIAGGTTVDNSSSVGVATGSAVAYAAAGAKLHSFRNAGVEKAFVDKDGNVEVTTVGAGFILKSPDGTRYLVKVANGGALSTSAA